MTTTTDIASLISCHADVRNGRPIIAGTGVSVRQIVACYRFGQTPEEIADQYSHLTLAQVYAALAFYHANPIAVNADLDSEIREYDRLAQMPHRQH